MVSIVAAAKWWEEMNDSVSEFQVVEIVVAAAKWLEEMEGSASQWQVVKLLYTLICIAYAVVGVVALLQTILIQLRVREFRWTTQKLFHFMNFIVCGARAITFGFHNQVFALKPRVSAVALLELPGILFLSTYTLLVLFWAQIYHQARGSSCFHKIQPAYLIMNGLIYVIKVSNWIFMWRDGNNVVLEPIVTLFVGLTSFLAALGFLLYGVRLFLMLRWFPIEDRRRLKKIGEVKCVTAICFTCFLIRGCFVVAVQPEPMKSRPILDLIYYALVEIIPSGTVLFILRELPPKNRMPTLYHPLRRP